jgi:hypothetical protein
MEIIMFKKVTKSIMVLLVSIAVVTAFSASSFAAYCTNISIVKAGASVDGVTAKNQVVLKREGVSAGGDCDAWPLNTNIWFSLMPENQDAMLATSLTALSLDNKVTVVCATVPCPSDHTGVLVTVTVDK